MGSNNSYLIIDIIDILFRYIGKKMYKDPLTTTTVNTTVTY